MPAPPQQPAQVPMSAQQATVADPAAGSRQPQHHTAISHDCLLQNSNLEETQPAHGGTEPHDAKEGPAASASDCQQAVTLQNPQMPPGRDGAHDLQDGLVGNIQSLWATQHERRVATHTEARQLLPQLPVTSNPSDEPRPEAPADELPSTQETPMVRPPAEAEPDALPAEENAESCKPRLFHQTEQCQEALQCELDSGPVQPAASEVAQSQPESAPESPTIGQQASREQAAALAEPPDATNDHGKSAKDRLQVVHAEDAGRSTRLAAAGGPQQQDQPAKPLRSLTGAGLLMMPAGADPQDGATAPHPNPAPIATIIEGMTSEANRAQPLPHRKPAGVLGDVHEQSPRQLASDWGIEPYFALDSQATHDDITGMDWQVARPARQPVSFPQAREPPCNLPSQAHQQHGPAVLKQQLEQSSCHNIELPGLDGLNDGCNQPQASAFRACFTKAQPESLPVHHSMLPDKSFHAPNPGHAASISDGMQPQANRAERPDRGMSIPAGAGQQSRPVPAQRKPRRTSGPLKIARPGNHGAGKKGGGWKKRQRVPLIDCNLDGKPANALPQPSAEAQHPAQQHRWSEPREGPGGEPRPARIPQGPASRNAAQPDAEGGMRDLLDAGLVSPQNGLAGLPESLPQDGRRVQQSGNSEQRLGDMHRRARSCSSTEAATGVQGSQRLQRSRRSSPQSSACPPSPMLQLSPTAELSPAADTRLLERNGQLAPQPDQALSRVPEGVLAAEDSGSACQPEHAAADARRLPPAQHGTL